MEHPFSSNGEDPLETVPEESTEGISNDEKRVDEINSNERRDDTPADRIVPLDSEGPLYSTFSKPMKTFLIVMTMFGTLFSPFSSFIYLPVIDELASFYNQSLTNINFTVTVFQVMQAIAPMFIADIGDEMGRRPAYIITYTIYLAANIGLALQSNFAALLVLRALQSTGSSGTVALGNGVVADLVTSSERGSYITYVQAAVTVAPALAPVLGGVLGQFLGWRSIFWFLTIASGVYLIIYIIAVPETGRRIVGNGSIPPPALNKSPMASWQWRRKIRDMERNNKTLDTIPTPKKLSDTKFVVPHVWAAIRVVFEKDIGPLMVFMSMFLMANYAMLVPLQNVIRTQYHLNTLEVGLCYIPFSAGSAVGAYITGRMLNWNYTRVARSIGVTPDRKRGDELRNFPIERARLGIMWPPTLLASATIIVWGWVVDSGTSLAVPLVILFISGMCLAAPMGVTSALLVDLYPMNPSRVSASFNLCRSSLSAVGIAVVQYIINAWGFGWTYVFLGVLTLLFSPSIEIVQRYGPKWREERYIRFEKAAKAKKEKEEAKKAKA